MTNEDDEENGDAWTAEVDENDDDASLDLDDLLGPDHGAAVLPLRSGVLFPRSVGAFEIRAGTVSSPPSMPPSPAIAYSWR